MMSWWWCGNWRRSESAARPKKKSKVSQTVLHHDFFVLDKFDFDYLVQFTSHSHSLSPLSSMLLSTIRTPILARGLQSTRALSVSGTFFATQPHALLQFWSLARPCLTFWFFFPHWYIKAALSEKKQFIVIAHDHTDADALKRRLTVRETHLAAARAMKKDGTLQLGGALLTDHSESGKMIGSIMIFSAENIQEVKELVEKYEIHYISSPWVGRERGWPKSFVSFLSALISPFFFWW